MFFRNPPRDRHVELDILRSLAILMMVFYHIGFDLRAFFAVRLDLASPLWRVPQRVSAMLFLLLVGMSAWVAWNRARATYPTFWSAYRRPLRRGLTVLWWGLVITLVTYALIPGQYIRFGILHLIGVCMLLLPFTAHKREWNVVFGYLIVILGFLIGPVRMDTSPLLIPFGFIPLHFSTLDYYPLLPWGGIPFIGMGIAAFLYPREQRQIPPTPYWLHLLSVPGQHSLFIYLVHQPIILAALWWIMR